MTFVWISIAIALILLILWFSTQPKQGDKATNAPRDALPSGVSKSHPSIATPTPMPFSSALSPALEEEVRQLLVNGQKITALKRVRSQTGWGLKKAKYAVESVSLTGDTSKIAQRYDLPTKELEAEVRQLIGAGKKISAIKRVRELTGWGLKESKDYVESL